MPIAHHQRQGGASQPASSSSLLARMRERSQQGVSYSSSTGMVNPASVQLGDRAVKSGLADKDSKLVEELRAYLAKKPFGVSSSTLIHHFANKLPSQESKFVFRQVLRKIADFKAGSKKRRTDGVWSLKEAFYA